MNTSIHTEINELMQFMVNKGVVIENIKEYVKKNMTKKERQTIINEYGIGEVLANYHSKIVFSYSDEIEVQMAVYILYDKLLTTYE